MEGFKFGSTFSRTLRLTRSGRLQGQQEENKGKAREEEKYEPSPVAHRVSARIERNAYEVQTQMYALEIALYVALTYLHTFKNQLTC